MGKSSYTRVNPRRYSGAAGRLSAVVLLAASLGGCAGLGLPLGVDRTTTASVAPAAPVITEASFVDRVDPSDWESLRKAIGGAPRGASGGIAWSNPATGTTGTAAVAATGLTKGGICRTFATTINDMRGIRRYRGDACRGFDGQMRLKDVTPDDATIS